MKAMPILDGPPMKGQKLEILGGVGIIGFGSLLK